MAVAAVLAATAALGAVSNSHYDSSATTGGLQKVCDDFDIDTSDVLTATCNKVTLGIVSQVDASIDLQPDLYTECFGKFQSLTPLADQVKVAYDCEMHTDDLNDMVTWDAETGKLKLVAA